MEQHNGNGSEEAAVVIENGIPIPPKHYGHRHVKEKYPISKLKIGQSFFVPGIKTTDISWRVTEAKRRLNRKFTIRTENGGVRIWRV